MVVLLSVLTLFQQYREVKRRERAEPSRGSGKTRRSVFLWHATDLKELSRKGDQARFYKHLKGLDLQGGEDV